MKLIPRPDNQYRTQEQWIQYYNEKKQRMISLPDVFKLLNNREALESLRKDFKDHYLTTSTRIVYDPDNLSAEVIHHTNSTITKQKVIKLKEVPVYNPTYLNKLVETDAGLTYLKALIDNDKATKEQIIDLFTTLSGKQANKIRLWTPTQSERSNKQIRSVGIYFYDFDGFYVDADVWFGSGNGVSHGVIINSAKQSKFFSNKATFDIEEKIITIPMTNKIKKDIEKQQKLKKKIKIKWNLEVEIR